MQKINSMPDGRVYQIVAELSNDDVSCPQHEHKSSNCNPSAVCANKSDEHKSQTFDRIWYENDAASKKAFPPNFAPAHQRDDDIVKIRFNTSRTFEGATLDLHDGSKQKLEKKGRPLKEK